MKDRRILVETDSDKAKRANKDEDGLDDNPNAGNRTEILFNGVNGQYSGNPK